MTSLTLRWLSLLFVAYAVACGSQSAGPQDRASKPEAGDARAPAPVQVPPASLATGAVRIARVQRAEQVPRRLTVSGTVEVSPGGAAVLSAPTAARVSTLNVYSAQDVEQGQVLAVLEAPAVAVARAELRRSEALRHRAKRLVQQEQALELLRATSVRDSTLAIQDLELARAEYAAAEGRLRGWGTGKAGGAKVTIRAPFTGVVTHVGVVSGVSVSEGTMLVRLLKPGALAVLAHVPQANSAQVRPGPADVFAPGSAVPCGARVGDSLRQVEASSGTVPYRVAVDPCETPLLEGANVEVLLPLQQKGTERAWLTVDASAVTEFQGKQLVFRSIGSGLFQPVFVRDVEVWAGQAYFHGEGLEAADVATRGTLLLKGELLKGDLQ